MLENTVAKRKAVEASLRSGALFNAKITVNFRADVFKYLFKDNRECNSDDFPEDLFPPHWDTVYNKIGDGCRLQYPIILRPAIQWSKRAYIKTNAGEIVEKPRFCTEVLHIKLSKIRCN